MYDIIMDKIIDKTLSSKVLMAGNYYKHHHPGGISAVVQYWSENIEDLQYYATSWKTNWNSELAAIPMRTDSCRR